MTATDDQSLVRLRTVYGMTQIRQDPDGTWWIGSPLRPDLLNLESPAAAVRYLDSLPPAMIASLTKPRGADSEKQRKG